MMTVSMFPSENRIVRTERWALDASEAVQEPYGRWFATVLRSVSSPTSGPTTRPARAQGDECITDAGPAGALVLAGFLGLWDWPADETPGKAASTTAEEARISI